MARCDTLSRAVMKGFDIETKQIYLFQPRCKMWSCLPCANTNRLLWQAKISHGFEKYVSDGIVDWRFITLTSHSKLKTADQCQFVWRSAWAKLSARLRRKHPGIRYVLIPEHHEDGRVHWHMIASHGVKHRWLKDVAPQVGLGFMTDCQEIETACRTIFYIAKYLGKSIGDIDWPRNLKRIRTSQTWPLLPPENDDHVDMDIDWKFWLKYPVEGLGYIAHELEIETGYKVKIIGQQGERVDNLADVG